MIQELKWGTITKCVFGPSFSLAFTTQKWPKYCDWSLRIWYTGETMHISWNTSSSWEKHLTFWWNLRYGLERHKPRWKKITQGFFSFYTKDDEKKTPIYTTNLLSTAFSYGNIELSVTYKVKVNNIRVDARNWLGEKLDYRNSTASIERFTRILNCSDRLIEWIRKKSWLNGSPIYSKSRCRQSVSKERNRCWRKKYMGNVINEKFECTTVFCLSIVEVYWQPSTQCASIWELESHIAQTWRIF